MSDMGRLAQLALHPKETSRAEIYLAVASLYRLQENALSDRERALMDDILRRLANDVELAVRIALAEKLADDPKAPRDLILVLARDRIEVARPLLLRSPTLSDADMLSLIAQCGVEHHEVIAARPNIGETVCDALARSENQSVLVALAGNASASMNQKLATPSSPSMAVAETKTAIPSDLPPAKTPSADGAQKLIDKLSASGQLKAGFLLRALNQGQTDLFDLGLAKLVNLPVLELRSRFYRGGPRAVALACRGVGIDRCVFNTVFNLSRQVHNMHTSLSRADLVEVDRIFAIVPKTSALSELSGPTFN
jgi:uncharacterized protein (DUF2336 family)